MVLMEGMLSSLTYSMVLIPPEDLAGYFVTAFFTIINLLITYVIVKHFLFKPAVKFMKKRQDKVTAELDDAKKKNKEANQLLGEAKQRVDNSTHEATSIVDEAKVQAEKQSNTIIENARHEAAEIVARAHKDAELMKKVAVEEMRNEVADLSLAIAYKVISQTVDESKQRELVDRFIGEDFEGTVKKDA